MGERGLRQEKKISSITPPQMKKERRNRHGAGHSRERKKRNSKVVN